MPVGAHGPFWNAQIIVQGVDLSDHCDSLTINETAAQLDDSAMGDYTDVQRAGLFSWTIEASFFQDFAAGSVDVTLHPLFSGRSDVLITCMPDKDAGVGVTNPMYSGLAFISAYTPMGGSHGDNLMTPVTFSPRGELVRLTT